jgi:hypothetical protein
MAAERKEAAAPASPNTFAAHSLWDDGQAEISAYDAVEQRYGAGRPFTAYIIVVKEDFSRSQLVKADPGHNRFDLMPVLKMNQVIHYQTGIYAYQQMASCFFERASMDLVKFSVTSSEWCGNSYKEYQKRDHRASLHVHTYWDGEAEADYDLPVGPDVVLYDQMPLWVRTLPQRAGEAMRLRLVPGQISSRGSEPQPLAALLEAKDEAPVETPAGRFTARRWELQYGAGRRDLYWTAGEYPYLLVAWDKPDGGRYRLKWTQRLAYWKLNAPGGERYLEGPLPGQTPR